MGDFVVFGDLNGKGRSHASRFPKSRKVGKGFVGLSTWSRNVVMRTRPKQETCTHQPFRGSALRCIGVCRVKRLDALVVLSREERKNAILVRLVVVTHDHMEMDKEGTSLC